MWLVVANFTATVFQRFQLQIQNSRCKIQTSAWGHTWECVGHSLVTRSSNQSQDKNCFLQNSHSSGIADAELGRASSQLGGRGQKPNIDTRAVVVHSRNWLEFAV